MSPDAIKVADYLEARVRKRGINTVITYNDLANTLRFPAVTDAWFSHPFCGIFDELDRDDHAKRKPFRTALVITEATKYPGAGFWSMALRLRYPKKAKFSELEMMTFYSKEVQDLAAAYPK